MSLSATTLLSSFVRIPSTADNPAAYKEAAEFLRSLMVEVGLENVRVVDYSKTKTKPIVLGSLWTDEEPGAPSLLLSGHYDVVPVEREKWTETVAGPFGGEVKAGRIYGRGTQDMKSVLIQYILGLGQIKATGRSTTSSNCHIVCLPDEEIGGAEGAKLLLESEEFAALNVQLVLDEGLACEENEFKVFYGERAINYVKLTVSGPTGHGSRFVPNTAVETMTRVLGNIYKLRARNEEKMCACNLTLGDVMTLNVTSLQASSGGHNVIPSEAECVVDIRVPLNVPDLLAFVKGEILEGDVDLMAATQVTFIQQSAHAGGLGASRTQFWKDRVKKAVEDAVAGAVKVGLEIFPAATDSRFYRRLKDLPCFGFSPIRNTPVLLHDHNEWIGVAGLEEGVAIYAKVVQTLLEQILI